MYMYMYRSCTVCVGDALFSRCFSFSSLFSFLFLSQMTRAARYRLKIALFVPRQALPTLTNGIVSPGMKRSAEICIDECMYII